MAEIQFTVIGLPQPAGSKRAFPFHKKNGKLGVAVSDSNPKAHDWKNAVASVAVDTVDDGDWCDGLLRGPLRLMMVFTLPRPKSHFKKNGELTGRAPQYPTTRPDTQKLARGTTDALTGIIWHDDSQIVEERLVKRYGEPARCDISVTEIELKDFEK